MLVKRGTTWHADFFIDGVRYRQSLKTSDKREAKSKLKDAIALAKDGKLQRARTATARLLFREAVAVYIEDPLREVKPETRRSERSRVQPMNKLLGNRSVRAITPEDVLTYIRDRREQGKAPATVNWELGIIRSVLKRAKRWRLFADDVKGLTVKQRIGRALRHEEKVRLLKTAASKPEWETTYCAIVLALNTTMRGCELKGLRWRDVDFIGRTLTVTESKTDAGERAIPLNPDAMAALEALYRRAQQVGGAGLDHFVFYACESGHMDPTKPQKGWRSSWYRLRAAAGLPTLRFHDLRHHAITELAESRTSDSTIMAIAGHVSAKMLRHYSHVRIEAARKALDGLATGVMTQNHDTKPVFDGETSPQVAELSVM